MKDREYDKSKYKQDFPDEGYLNWKRVRINVPDDYRHNVKIMGVLLHDGNFVANGVLFLKDEFRIIDEDPLNLRRPTDYKEQPKEVKQIIIDLATEFGYGDPEYTNMDKVDYKFWEDCDNRRLVFVLANKLAKIEAENKEMKSLLSVLRRYDCDIEIDESEDCGYLVIEPKETGEFVKWEDVKKLLTEQI